MAAASERPSQALIDAWLGRLDLDVITAPACPGTPGGADAARFRDVLGRFCTGVTIVTGLPDGVPVGLTCQSFCAVSLDPPLVLFCPSRASRSWPAIERAGQFCVNLLAEDQLALADVFAARGAQKFGSASWHPSFTGAPLLDGVLGWVDCTVQAVHQAGDHHVVIGRVVDLGVAAGSGPGTPAGPLLYYRSRYTGTR